MSPFTPKPAGTVAISVSASSQAQLVASEPGVRQIRVMNNGSATVWIDFGGSTVSTTAATGIPVPPGAIEVLTVKKSDGPIYAAAIAAAATGSIYFTPGTGI